MPSKKETGQPCMLPETVVWGVFMSFNPQKRTKHWDRFKRSSIYKLGNVASIRLTQNKGAILKISYSPHVHQPRQQQYRYTHWNFHLWFPEQANGLHPRSAQS